MRTAISPRLATSIFLIIGHRFFDKNNAKSYHCWLMFNRVRHVEFVRVAPVRC
jgi:uncharacterized membrane protein YbaN (DUF454 family)